MKVVPFDGDLDAPAAEVKASAVVPFDGALDPGPDTTASDDAMRAGDPMGIVAQEQFKAPERTGSVFDNQDQGGPRMDAPTNDAAVNERALDNARQANPDIDKSPMYSTGAAREKSNALVAKGAVAQDKAEAERTKSSGNTAQDIALNVLGGFGGTVNKAGATISQAVGAEDAEAAFDSAAEMYKKMQADNGGGMLPGKVAGFVGSVAPALAVSAVLPASEAYVLLSNAGLFALPAFRDTLKEKLAAGQDFPLALAHASQSFGLNLFLPNIASRGGALLNNAAGKGIIGNAASAAAEGAGFSAATTVLDKGTDLVAGEKNQKDWLDFEDMGTMALGFGAMRGIHGAAGAAARGVSAGLDRVGSPSQQFGRALGQDVDAAGFNRAQPANLNPNLRDVAPKAADPVAEIFKTGSVEEAAAAAAKAADIPVGEDTAAKLRAARPARPVAAEADTLPGKMQDDENTVRERASGGPEEGVVRNEGPLHEPQEPGVSRLRGEGDQGSSGVDGRLPSVRGPHGSEADQGPLAGPEEQQRALRAGQRALGDADRAGAEQAEQSAGGVQGADANGVRVGGSARDTQRDPRLAAPAMDGGKGADVATDTVGRASPADVRVGRSDPPADALGEGGRDALRNTAQPNARGNESTRRDGEATAQVAHEEAVAKPEPFATKPEANMAALKEDAVAVPAEGGWTLQLKTRPYSDKEVAANEADIAAINDGLNHNNEARAEAGLPGDREPVRLLTTAPTPQMVVGRRIARLLGVKVVFVEDHPGFSGVALRGVAYVSPQAKHPELAIIGHEVTHGILQRLRAEDPARAQALHEQIAAYVRPEAVDKKQAAEPDRSRKHAEEEVIADLNGSMWLDPKFWAEMRKNDPSTFRKVAYAFMQAVAHVGKNLSRFRAEEFTGDVDAVRKILAREMSMLAREEAVESHSPTEKQELGIKDAAKPEPKPAEPKAMEPKPAARAETAEPAKPAADEAAARGQEPMFSTKGDAGLKAQVLDSFKYDQKRLTRIDGDGMLAAKLGKDERPVFVMRGKFGREQYKQAVEEAKAAGLSNAKMLVFADMGSYLPDGVTFTKLSDIPGIPKAGIAAEEAAAARGQQPLFSRKPSEVTREEARQMGDLRKKVKVLESLLECLG